jgi:hypothetical protein
MSNKPDSRLKAPEIGNLEEEASFGFQEPVAFDVLIAIPFKFLECSTVSDISDCSRNISK